MIAPVVWLRAPISPYPRIARVAASNVHRAYQLAQSSQAEFDVARDAWPAEYYIPGVMVEIIGATRRPWLGVLKSSSDSVSSGMEHWVAEDLFAQLDERPVHAFDFSTTVGLGFTALCNDAQRVSPMSMSINTNVDAGETLKINIAEGSLLSALETLAQDSRWNILLSPGILGPASCDPTLVWRWGGFDLSPYVTVVPWAAVTTTRDVDAKGSPSGVRAQGDKLYELASMTPSAGGAPASPPSGTNADLALSPSISAFMPGVAMVSAVQDPTVQSLVGAGGVATAYGTESLAITVNNRFDWASLDVGEYVKVKLTAQHGGRVERVLRVIGMQPDEAAGEMDLLLNATDTWGDSRGAI